MKKKLVRGTLVLLEKNGRIILAPKKHKVGIGCYCGYGGKIEPGERIRQAALRELGQESGVFALPEWLVPMARVDFHNRHGSKSAYTFRVYVYYLRRWRGRPVESAEMGPPEQFSIEQLPFDSMMAGDRLWLPPVLQGKRVFAEVWYGKDQHTLVGKKFHMRSASTGEMARL